MQREYFEPTPALPLPDQEVAPCTAHSRSPASDMVPLSRLRRKSADPQGLTETRLELLSRHLAEFEGQLRDDEKKAFASILGSRNMALSALGAAHPEQILEASEIKVLNDLQSSQRPRRGALPFSVTLIMKATRLCNLRCTYCYSWRDEPNEVMSPDVLANTIRGVLTMPGVRSVEFVWHGGEPTLLPIAFYTKALWLQEQFRQPGQTIVNNLQTNGTHLTDDWLLFLKRYGLRVGLSLDGPPAVHDSRRIDIRGRPTSALVRSGLAKLQEQGIRHGVLVVVDSDVVRLGPDQLLQYLLELGVTRVSLLNVTPQSAPPLPSSAVGSSYLAYRHFVEYLRRLFHLWYPMHAARLRIRELSDLLGQFNGAPSHFCVYRGNCVGQFFTIEANGDICHCDKYDNNPAYRFGNVLTDGVERTLSSATLHRAQGYVDAGLDRCRACPWFAFCQGGCPYDRYVQTAHQSDVSEERCCGLAPLLTDMAQAIGKDMNPSPYTNNRHNASTTGSAA